MDDFVVFDDDKNHLRQIRQHIIEYLGKLRLRLHEDKCRVYRTSAGVPFLGMMISPGSRRLKRQNVMRFKRRLKEFQRLYKEGAVSWAHIYQSVQSWIGHAKHADTARLRELVLADVVFRKG